MHANTLYYGEMGCEQIDSLILVVQETMTQKGLLHLLPGQREVFLGVNGPWQAN